MAFPAGTVRISQVDADGVGELQITNPSGGLLAGDRMDTVIAVGPNARLSVVTQGANRVCGAATGAPIRTTVLDTRLTVADGAVLEWVPHHLVPYARARVHQRTAVALAPTAGLIAWEALSTGRSARGERAAWDRVDSRLRVTDGQRPLVADGAVLDSGGEPFDGADLTATLVVRLPPRVDGRGADRAAGSGPRPGGGSLGRAGNLADALHGRAGSVPGVLASASALDERLVVARVLARDTAALYALLAVWRPASRQAVRLPPASRAVD